MTARERLLKRLNDAIFTEESAIPVYARHLDTALFWRGMSGKNHLKIRKYLEILGRQSANHKLIFERIKKLVETGRVRVR